ncbi:MAG: tetratricopeptide repeat protein [Spirochaetaceae bacterium]|jgi:tetratricopeptide (TPR) repeat protein|nr:tetratricopeptide repeat protein [Spirochaetaceae bacterium]
MGKTMKKNAESFNRKGGLLPYGGRSTKGRRPAPLRPGQGPGLPPRAESSRRLLPGHFPPKRAAGLLALLVALGCSSTPKGPVETRTLRNAAGTQLELANRQADRGNYEGALELLAEARRLAFNADDPALIVRTYLSLGNAYSYLGRAGEAAASWDSAAAEAGRAGDGELLAVCEIYRERRRLFDGGAASAASARDRVQAALGRIKTSPADQAFAWTVIGLAEKELRRFAEAEAALKKALALHSRSPEQAAYDWYLIASARSVAGNYGAALEALEEALALDRRVENGYGLGKDWLARGDVLSRAGRPAEAEAAWRRAAEIFASAGLDAEAQTAAQRR